MKPNATIPSDDEIVAELVAELIECHRIAPFRFGISYNAKQEPARVTVHKVVKNGTLGEVEFSGADAARKWCKQALKEGYVVQRLLGRDVLDYSSLSARKRMYENRVTFEAMTPAQRKALDDEIPF